jgi:uncharacterized protein YerC
MGVDAQSTRGGEMAERMHYSEISRSTGASTATITRIASWLHR